MEAAKTIAAILTLFIGVPLVIATAIDKITLRPRQPARSEEEMEKELLEPDWEALSRHFGSPPSETLRSLYRDKEKILRREFEVASSDPGETHYLAGFLPARLDSLNDWDLTKGHFPFASDGCGNCYTVRWGEEPVYYWDHEDGEETEIEDSLTAFM